MLLRITRDDGKGLQFRESANSTAGAGAVRRKRRNCCSKPHVRANGDGGHPVALIADSGALYALYDRADAHHPAVNEAVAEETGPIILPSAILAEIDYLLRVRLGLAAELALLKGIATGSLTVEPFRLEDANRCQRLLKQYADLDLGLADAAVIATADRLGVRRILTVDERDFRAVRTSQGEPFVLLPADRPQARRRRR